MIKLVAVDLDDTLLSSEITISEGNKRALAECRAKGVQVVIATGRMFRAATRFAEELELDLPIITYQGALVKSLDHQEWFHHVIEKEQAARLIEDLKSYGLQLNVYMNDQLYVEKLNDFGSEYVRFSRVDHFVTSFPEGLVAPPTKILLAGNPAVLDGIHQEVLTEFGGELTINKSKEFFLEFGNLKSKKSYALNELAESLGIRPEEILAVGDGMNDLDMIAYAGIGVAMGNAQKEVQEIADYITDTNDRDGVARALEKFVL